MSKRPVNDAQRATLDWLAGGGSQDPPHPKMKRSAGALSDRELARIRRVNGKWTAELTDAGRYYVEHGEYPSKAQLIARKPRPRPAKPKPAPDSRPDTPPERPAVDTTIPLRQVVLRPHPAVRELRDRPKRLPEGLRHRCVLIAHSLVTEALARGWTVTPVVGVIERRDWEPRYTRYDSPALLFLDAGHAQVGIVFNEVTKRVPHEDTKDEAARRARGDYVWAPAYDHIGDGRLRLHLTSASGHKLSKSWTDGVRMQIEDRISDVLGAVEKESHDAVAREEARIRHEEEERLRRLEAQRIDGLRREYEEWEAALHTGTTSWLQHRELSAFVDSFVDAGGDESRAFVDWARAHLAAVDPRQRVPTGEAPAWPHEERARRGRYEPKPRYGW